MAERRPKTDVVIIGLGAAGGIAAHVLTEKNVKVVGLEAGPRLSIPDFPSDEIRNDIRNQMGAVKVNQEVPTTRRNRDEQAGPAEAPILMMNGVGGTSIHYTAQTWRFSPWNFKMRSETIKRYGAGKLNGNDMVQDWPFSYADLEPYYDRVEYLIGVSGKAGNIQGRKIEGGNVLEGPRRREYPLAPLRSAGWVDKASETLERLDWKPFPLPAAILSEPYGGNAGCQYCGFCTNNGCHVNAKSSTFLNAIPKAEETGNLEIVPGARVRRIETDRDGLVTGVTYVKGGTEYFQPATAVVLATYCYENNRLMMLSRSRAHPRGIGNSTGWLGKGYISHGYITATAYFDERLNRFSGPGAQGVSSDAWEADNFDHGDLDFIGGANIQAAMEAKPIGTARTVPPSLERGWGSDWKAWMKRHGQGIATTLAQMEVLPREENFLDLDPDVKDPTGMPVIRVTFDYSEEDLARSAFLGEKLVQWLEEAGAEEAWVGEVAYLPVNSHAYGGTRLGDDPETSVVNAYGLTHDAPNLCVMGASTFLNTTGKNPTETVQAIAWRDAENLADNLDSIGRGET